MAEVFERNRVLLERVEKLADEIAQITATIEASKRIQLERIREFDEIDGWAIQGAKSCAHWLSYRTGLSLVTAREHVRVAGALGKLPKVDEALGRGEISYRAIARVANEETEQTLVEWAGYMTGAQLESVCRRYARIREVDEPSQDEAPKRRWINVSQDEERGVARISGQLLPHEGALVDRAITAAMLQAAGAEELVDDSAESTASREVAGALPAAARQVLNCRRRKFTHADAFVAAAESYLAQYPRPDQVPGRYEVVLHVDEAALTGEGVAEYQELDDGTPVSRETARRITCDAAKVFMVRGEDGAVLGVGRRTRTIPPSLRRALTAREGSGCQFPGCDNRIWVEAHHIVHWVDGGETTLGNLVILCRRHHRLIHGEEEVEDAAGGERFSVERTSDGVLVFRDPEGRVIPAVPERPEIPSQPYEALVRDAAARGVEITPETSLIDWDGKPLDYAWALDALYDIEYTYPRWRRERAREEVLMGPVGLEPTT